jgi:hypothetical protein
MRRSKRRARQLTAYTDLHLAALLEALANVRLAVAPDALPRMD